MSFFNLFRRSKTDVHNKAMDTATVKPPIAVEHQLFVEEEAPELKNPVKKTINPIEVFLDQNFEWQGYNDGYSHPETDYLVNKSRILRSEFRLAVDKCMDARRTEVGNLKLHLIQTNGISPRLEEQLNEKVRQVEVTIHELDIQKILSAEDEGMISTATHSYRLGFIRGLERYQQEKLFAGSTGLFNQ